MQTPDSSVVTNLLGNTHRTKILVFLMDNRFHTVNEITRATTLKANTISFHLAKLTAQNWLESYVQGRWHYFRLADRQIADLIEQILVVSPQKNVHSFRENKQQAALQNARTCYSHLAGKLGVVLMQQLVEKNWITQERAGLTITSKGFALLEKHFEIVFTDHECRQNDLILPCIDWSERKFHLKGLMGRRLLEAMFDQEWLYRPNQTRAVALTKRGKQQFNELFK